MPGTIYISGLYSGINWAEVIDQIIQVEQRRIDILEEEKNSYENKLSAWQELNTKLLNVKTAAEDLADASVFNVFNVSLTASTGEAEDFLVASAGTDAQEGVYEIVIKQLAQAKVDKSKSFSSASEALNLSGTLQLRKVGETDWVDITIETTDTLTDIKNKINQHTDETGVVASIVQYADNDYRLILTAQETGTDNAFEVGQTDVAATTDGLGFWDDAFTTENIAIEAQNAIVNVYGEDAERNSNIITDLIPGITLNLKNADENVTITLTISRDIDTIVGNIKDFFDKINEVFEYINNQYTYTEDDETAPPLIGDSTLSLLQSDLREKLSNGITWDSTTHYLFEIGITVDENGIYTVDEETLSEALTNNFETVRNLLAETEETTGIAAELNEFLEFITDEYQEGYVQTRMDELQTNIDNIDEQIEEIERQLEQERERLFEQFNALETYLAQMRQLQAWLEQQLSVLSQ